MGIPVRMSRYGRIMHTQRERKRRGDKNPLHEKNIQGMQVARYQNDTDRGWVLPPISTPKYQMFTPQILTS